MQYSKIILSQIGCQHAVNRYFVFTLRMSQFLNLIQQFAPVGESRYRIGNFSGGIPNPDLWNPEYGVKNPDPNKDWNPESKIQYLKSGIHGVESRFQDCLGFAYMG